MINSSYCKKNLKIKILLLLILPVLLVAGAASAVMAESAIQCHCFKDRSYNPVDTFASDEYILATSFNSLMANHFSTSKRKIIMIKMNEGVAQNDLLIGLKVSRLTGVDLRKYLRLRKDKNSWTDIVSKLSSDQKIKDDAIMQGIKAGMAQDEAAEKISDEVLSEFYGVSTEEVKELRKSGLNEKEMALALIIIHLRGVKPSSLVALSKKQGQSWSEIAFKLGIKPAEAGKYILAYPDKKLPE